MDIVQPGDAILVTGATGAIGFEIAAQAAEAGAVVGVHGSQSQTVAEAIARLRERVGDQPCLIAAPCDFTDAPSIDAMVDQFAAAAGRLDAVIHCAITGAAGSSGYLGKTDPESFGTHAALVLGTVQRICWAALPHLSQQGGTFIAFASDAGRFAAPRQTIIGAAFGGIMAFVRNAATELSRDKVRIHCLSPSYVAETPIFERVSQASGRNTTALERAGLGLPTPRDIAPLALFLCSPAASKITGQVISINGGLNA